MSSGNRWNADVLGHAYVLLHKQHEFLGFRKDALQILANNIMAAAHEGLPVLTLLDNHQRQWNSFLYTVDENIKKVLQSYSMEDEFDIHELREGPEQAVKDKIDNIKNLYPTGSDDRINRLRLLFMIVTCKRSDYDALVKKIDAIAYDFWKGTITYDQYSTMREELLESPKQKQSIVERAVSTMKKALN